MNAGELYDEYLIVPCYTKLINLCVNVTHFFAVINFKTHKKSVLICSMCLLTSVLKC